MRQEDPTNDHCACPMIQQAGSHYIERVTQQPAPLTTTANEHANSDARPPAATSGTEDGTTAIHLKTATYNAQRADFDATRAD
eukprot:3884989-Pyramimonas_sp.AAC.1